ncbi:MAG: AAA family ATPase [Candidatus Solibacter sp.]
MTPLVEKYRPLTLDGFIGMERPTAILRALAAEPYESAWLLLGPSGLGKTTMALAVAELIGGQVHHIPSRNCDLDTVERETRSCHYAPMFGGSQWHVILCDEADQMTQAAQLAFLSKLDTTAKPPNTIFLFTANSTKKLQDRFKSRCRVLEFSHRGLLDALVGLLAKVWTAETAGPAPDFVRIARASKLNIREALMMLELEMIAPSSPDQVGESLVAVFAIADITEAAGAAEAARSPVSIDAQFLRRQEAAKRAWVTMRANRARRAAAG